MRDLLDASALLGVLQGAALALVLLLRRRDALANRLLGALVGAVAALLLADYCEGRWALSGHPHLLALGAPLPFTFGPLLYLYIVALTRPVRRADPRWLVHALPALMDLAYMTVRFYVLDGDEKLAVVRAIREDGAPLSLHVIRAAQAVQAVAYLAASWRELQGYGLRMRGYFSDLARVDLRWLRAMVLAHAATWSFAILSTALSILGMENVPPPVLSRGVEVGATLVIFLTGYMSLWQPELFDKAAAAARVDAAAEVTAEPSPEPAATPHAEPARGASEPTPALAAVPAPDNASTKYQRNRIDDAEAAELSDRLLALMTAQRPYRDGGLTLPVLADALGITPHALSQILNVRLGKTFYAFVNGYRVGELKVALADPARQARGVLELALEVGFNSKSTLNSFFKRETGMTPTQYREHAQKTGRQIEAA